MSNNLDYSALYMSDSMWSMNVTDASKRLGVSRQTIYRRDDLYPKTPQGVPYPDILRQRSGVSFDKDLLATLMSVTYREGQNENALKLAYSVFDVYVESKVPMALMFECMVILGLPLLLESVPLDKERQEKQAEVLERKLEGLTDSDILDEQFVKLMFKYLKKMHSFDLNKLMMDPLGSAVLALLRVLVQGMYLDQQLDTDTEWYAAYQNRVYDDCIRELIILMEERELVNPKYVVNHIRLNVCIDMYLDICLNLR